MSRVLFLLFSLNVCKEKKNKSGSVSVQIISKSNGKYKVVKSLGSSTSSDAIFRLVLKAKQEIKRLETSPSLFVLENDVLIESFLNIIESTSTILKSAPICKSASIRKFNTITHLKTPAVRKAGINF